MSTRRNSVKVSILGEEYAIRSEATPEHVRAVATHVDTVVRRLMQSGAVIETHKAAVLAALQLTDELFRARSALGETAAGVRELSGEVRRMLPPQKRGVDNAEAGAVGAPEPAGPMDDADEDWFGGEAGATGR